MKKSPSKRSRVTAAAQAALRNKKIDAFVIASILLFVVTFFTLELSLLYTLKSGGTWSRFLDLNGILLTTFGAAWTALGVRMSSHEKDALQKLKKNTNVAIEEILHSLSTASNFASLGAWSILLGGTFFFVKAAFRA